MVFCTGKVDLSRLDVVAMKPYGLRRDRKKSLFQVGEGGKGGGKGRGGGICSS